MKLVTWKDAFLLKTTPSELRIQNNLNIPDEYNRSVFRLYIILAVYYLIAGIIIGYGIAIR